MDDGLRAAVYIVQYIFENLLKHQIYFKCGFRHPLSHDLGGGNHFRAPWLEAIRRGVYTLGEAHDIMTC